jgi:hypothetical protein
MVSASLLCEGDGCRIEKEVWGGRKEVIGAALHVLVVYQADGRRTEGLQQASKGQFVAGEAQMGGKWTALVDAAARMSSQ